MHNMKRIYGKLLLLAFLVGPMMVQGQEIQARFSIVAAKISTQVNKNI